MNIKKFIPAILAIVLITLSSFTSNTDLKENNSGKTIVDVAVANENFSTLVAAVKAANLVEVLSSEGPFTVFAPVNDAFSKLPEGTVASLLKPENKDLLTAILTDGKVILTDVKGNISTIVITDVEASNGVIHAIDSVVMPE